MSWRDIRPVAVGVARRDDEVLLCRLHEEGTGTFYRPIGGGIEFGEASEEALVREFREELDVEVDHYDHLETFEDTFSVDGSRAHEIWFCYAVSFAESWPYHRDEFEGEEPEQGETYTAVWVPVAALDDLTVYPEELGSFL